MQLKVQKLGWEFPPKFNILFAFLFGLGFHESARVLLGTVGGAFVKIGSVDN